MDLKEKDRSKKNKDSEKDEGIKKSGREKYVAMIIIGIVLIIVSTGLLIFVR